jgi:dTDP-4-amino-4,6-dideoxygalactose transaminase
VHYPAPLHHLRAFADAVRTPVPLRVAEDHCRQVLSLPLNPQLSDAEVETVATVVSSAASPAHRRVPLSGRRLG